MNRTANADIALAWAVVILDTINTAKAVLADLGAAIIAHKMPWIFRGLGFSGRE